MWWVHAGDQRGPPAWISKTMGYMAWVKDGCSFQIALAADETSRMDRPCCGHLPERSGTWVALSASPHGKVLTASTSQQVSLGRRRMDPSAGLGIMGCPALAKEYTLAQPSPSDIMKDLHIPQSVWTFCYETLERNFILLLLPAINLMKCFIIA